MPLPPSYNHGVTLAEASVLTATYRKRSPIGAVKGGLFWKEAVEQVIIQEGCVAMRYYYAQQDDGTPALVLVGVDKDGRDMTGGFLAELSTPCPPWCDEPNALNSSFAERKRSLVSVPAVAELSLPREKKENSIPVEL